MTKPFIVIHNTTTGEIIEREMTAQELAQQEADLAVAEAKAQVKAEAQAKRQTLLAKLGITEDEAKLLLGGI
jgi:hypothetical protein